MIARNHHRLRIVHVSLGLDMGGQEKLLVEFARHADRSRFEFQFVSLSTRGALADAIEDQGWPVTALETPPGLRPGLVWRLSRLFRGSRPDVVHTHDARPLVYGALAGRLAGVPVQVHTKHFATLPAIGRRQVFLCNLASRLTDAFVCVSKDSARQAIAGGVSAGRVRTIWNGIDLERFPFCGPALEGPVVTVARLSPEKDQANLLQAAARVVRRMPSFRLEIAGNGPCWPELQRLTKALDLDSNVRFLGEVRDIPALLCRARLFVLPSRTEGIALTLLEAMASGLPVLATRVGGNGEVVMDNQTGRLVPPADPGSLANAMLGLLDNPEESWRLGQAGRRRVEQFFDVRRMVARYEALYEEKIQGKKQCRSVPTQEKESGVNSRENNRHYSPV